MHRLIAALCVLTLGCVKQAPVRDQLAVEQHRSRITKVRNAIDETRQVIASSQGAAYLPELYMRLAELTSEEAKYHYLVAFEREQGRAEALHLPQVRILKEQAIATYETLVARYPEHPLADHALFNLAQEKRELGEYDDMRAALEGLVNRYPDSRHRADSLLLLGNYHFDKSEFTPSSDYYRQVISLGESSVLGLAHYKLAWVEMNLGDCGGAFQSFEDALSVADVPEQIGAVSLVERDVQLTGFGVQDLPPLEGAGAGAVDVRREALVDLTYCYATERKPELAAQYLYEHAANREIYVAALGKMARRFAVTEQPAGTAQVLRELLSLAPDSPDRLDDARLLHAVVTRTKDYRRVGRDVELIISAYQRQLARPDLDSEGQDTLTEEFETLTRDLVLRADRMLRGEERSTYTEVAATADQTIRAYEAYLKRFRDSETYSDLANNLADVLLKENQWSRAAHWYRTTAERIEEPKSRSELLYNAAVAFQKSLREPGSRVAHTVSRAGLRVVGSEVLRLGLLTEDRQKTVQFAIGRSYYDEGEYDRAVLLLTAVAYGFPGTEEGDAALDLVLDSYNTRNDISGLIAVGRRFASPESPIPEARKSQIRPILAAAEQRRLDDLSLAASGDLAGGMDVLLAFADRYEGTDLGERALLGTFVAARASGDTERLFAVGEQVLERYPASEQAGGVASTMGQVAATRYEFELAAKYLSMGAELTQDAQKRAALSLTAGELLQQLGDGQGAEQAYRAAVAKAPDPASRTEAVTKLARLIEQTRPPEDRLPLLQELNEPPQPEVIARIGMAHLELGQVDEAEMVLYDIANSPAASANAQAIAAYGSGEANLNLIRGFEAYADLSLVEELVGLTELASQSYLQAVGLGDARLGQAALARLSVVTGIAADKLASFPLPEEISAEEQQLLRDALNQRAQGLRESSDEALSACAGRAKQGWLLDVAGVSCLQGERPAENPYSVQSLSRRTRGAPEGLEDARDRLSRNAEDVEALRTIGEAFLEVGDAHVAQLAFERVVSLGGDGDDLVRLAEAQAAAGDAILSTQTLGRATAAGSDEAKKRLRGILEERGLTDLASGLDEEVTP